MVWNFYTVKRYYGAHCTFVNNILQMLKLFIYFPVRGGSAGNVPHGESEALLHRNEEVGTQETAEGDQEASEPVSGDVLWPLQFKEVKVKKLWVLEGGRGATDNKITNLKSWILRRPN